MEQSSASGLDFAESRDDGEGGFAVLAEVGLTLAEQLHVSFVGGFEDLLVKSAFELLSDLFDGVFEVIEFVDGIGEGERILESADETIGGGCGCTIEEETVIVSGGT